MSELVKIGNYTKIYTGKLDANASSDNGKYPFFTCSKEPLKIDSYSYDCECVLVAGNGDLNAKYYNGKFDAYQRTYIIESMDKSKLNVKYLYFFFDKYVDELRNQSIGGVIKYIKLGNLTDAFIPLPKIQQQQSIVKVLEKVNSLIDNHKKQLKLLDELVKARFVEMFGDPVINGKDWETSKLADLGDCKNGMNFHSGDAGIEVRCLGVGDFKDLSVIDDIDKLSLISLTEMPNDEYLLQNNDIVFVRSNGNKSLVGRCVIVYPNDNTVAFSGFCIRFRCKSKKINALFLLNVLKTDSIRKKMIGRGANIQNLNQQILSSLIIPMPPLELQNQFAAFVTQTDIEKSRVQQALEKLETLKKALMQKYFG